MKSRKTIQQLFESGKSFSVFPFRITFSKVETGYLQAGFSVSKRRFKRAVDRNGIKRLMREAWRLNAVPLREILEKEQLNFAVFLVFNGQEIPTFHEVETKINLIISALIEKIFSENSKE